MTSSNSINKSTNILKYFLYFIITIIIIVFIFILAFAVQAKSLALNAWEAKESLELAADNFRNKNFSESKHQAKIANNYSQEALNNLEYIKSKKINFLYNHYDELEDLRDILEVSIIISQTIEKSSEIFEDINLNNKDSNYLDNQDKFLELQQANPEINGLQANLSLAIYKIKKMQFNGWLSPFKPKFNSIRDDLSYSWNYIDKALPLVNALPDILGFPNATNYLLIFQNNDELRPSGGFIGSYAIIQANNTNFKTIITADSYHLDMPVKDTLGLEANPILNKYLKTEKMFLRDANWSPDWKMSAQNIDYVYDNIIKAWPQDKEIPFNEDFNYIIGITPDLVSALLNITGPIEYEGKVYNSQNFQAQLQKQVEIDYIEQGIPSWERKSVIASILKELEDRLFDLKMKDWPQLFYTLIDQAEKKNILIYSQNEYNQAIIENSGWSGILEKDVDDYIMVVDANMAALKTDAVMSRQLDYQVSIDDDNYTSHLNLNYTHLAKETTWRTSRYHSYTRVYLPINSRDIKVEGFANNSLNIYKDEILNKMVIAGYFTVNLDSKKEIDIYYKNNNINNNNYSFYLQKQAGSIWETNILINFNKDIKSFSPSLNANYSQSKDTINWIDTLSTDKKYIINF
jgi:hypothetical protein